MTDDHYRLLVERAEAELQALRETMETRVAERTAQLEVLTAQFRREAAERTSAEVALRASEGRLLTVITSVPIILFMLDKSGVFTLSAGRGLTGLGLETDEVLGRSAFELYQDYPDVTQALCHAYNGETFEGAVDVGDVSFQIWCDPITSEGQVRGVLGVALDITEQQRAERKLLQSEERFRALVETTSDWIWEVDAGGRYTYVSPKVESLLGYVPEDVIGKTPFDLMAPGEAEKLRVQFSAILATPRSFGGWQNWNLHKSGRAVLLETSGEPIMDAAGTLLGFRGVDRDVTARRQAEERQEQIAAFMQHAHKMEAIGELAGGVAHDFNNILTAIQGGAELLRMDATPGSEQAEIADQIFKASRRAADLTQQLLSFARKGHLRSMPIDIHSVVHEVAVLLSRTIDKRIQIDLDLQAKCPHTLGDPSQIHSAILNLGLNARDAMPSGGKLTISTRDAPLSALDLQDHLCAVDGGDYVQLSVTDTGIGMDEEVRQRLFEPFFTTKKDGKGTGLGLASVYGCVSGHGGSIRVRSQPGEGAVFDVILPVAADNTARDEDTADGKGASGIGHVLVVDDEEMVRAHAVRSLRRLGYRVSTCHDGEEAVSFCRAHHPDIDLVLLDLVMPTLGGEETFYELRKLSPELRIIVASGFSRNQAVDELLRAGAVAFLGKPFQFDALARLVARHIGTAPPASRTRTANPTWGRQPN